MKKIYFIALSVFTLSQSYAQLNLTKANIEPVVGDTYLMGVLDTTNALPNGITGAGAIWDVIGISESGLVDTTKYIAASADPNSSTYPGTTIVEKQGTNTTYFKSTATQFELLGLDAGNFKLNYNTNSAIVSVYPVGLGYINNDIGSGTMTASLSGAFTSTIQTMGDGSGTLSINSTVSFSNCLRVKTTQHISFSLGFGTETGTVDQSIYNYYHSSSKSPILSYNYTHVVASGAFPIDNSQSNITLKSIYLLGVKENSTNDIIFRAYPNPANELVNIHFVLTQNESYTIEVLNNLGQVVKTLNKPNLAPGIYSEVIDIKGLSVGIYTVKISGTHAQGVQKLIVN